MTVREFHRAQMQASFTHNISDETISAKTGRTWHEWDAILDGWQDAHENSAASARDLRYEFGISTWWSHTITTRYRWAHALLD
jgi:hypothetical protein